jgi:DnaJ-class molecular chaperone
MSLEALKAQLSRLRKVASRAERKQHFMKLCFQWHPDKNPTNVEFATKGFQLIQERRSQLLVS